MRRFALIIPAAGAGLRMKTEIPKPFLIIDDKPVLFHTLSSFSGLKGLVQVIVAVNDAYTERTREILESIFSGTQVDFQVVGGGKERQYSILKGLKKVEDVELIAVHDAVRPFVHAREVEECCKVAAESGGAVLGIKVRDTLKEVNTQKVILNTPDRSVFWQAQTPQVFQASLIKEAYKIALKKHITATDDASLVERIGGKVKMVEGSSLNIKITYPEDLKFAQNILKDWE